MATNLSWATPPGSIANFPIGNPASVTLLLSDTKNTGTVFTFNKIWGDLPPGLTLNSTTGTISGTPTYATSSNNYFITQTYEFIVRALGDDNRCIDGKFSIIITNTVNQDFTWVTPAGNLGTVPNGQFYALTLQAQSSNNRGITYSLVSGELPPGMQLVNHQVDKTVTLATLAAGTVLKVNNIQTIQVGDYVFGDYIVTNTRVTGINSTNKTVTLSAATTGAVPKDTVLKFYSPAFLQGVPTLLESVAVNESLTYRFTIRAKDSINHITDRAFSLNVTNISGPIIEPQTELLGSFFDGSYFSRQLTVTTLNPNAQIEWSIVEGSLPDGLSLDQTGLISGYIEPIQLVGAWGPAGFDGYDTTGNVVTQQQEYDTGPYQFNQINSSLGYNFTVRAYDGANYDLQRYVINTIAAVSGWTADNDIVTVDDDYLTVDYGNVYVPVIRNLSTTLPTGRQSSYYAFKVDGYDFDLGTGPGLTYKLVDTLGSYDGGPFDPLNRDDANNGLPGSFDLVSTTLSNLPGVLLDSDTGWIYGLINPQTTAYEEYEFGVKVCKDVVIGNASNIRVITNANVTVDTTQFITQRYANSAVAANLAVLANVTSYSNLYLAQVSGFITTLSNNSLWINNVTATNSSVTSSTLYVQEYCSFPKFFTFPVLGDPNSAVSWLTDSDLGIIDNGQICNLRVVAESAAGKDLIYSLVDEPGVSCRLPQGLKLLPTGEISGRATFEAFSLDDYTTTFDSETLTIDRTSTFRVRAATVDNTSDSEKTFTLTLNVIDTEPYENLYIKALPDTQQRQIYKNLISDATIFEPGFIYRPTDPNFGIQEDLLMLLLPGLTASELQEYQDAMVRNHFTKTYEFGQVKTAYVLDQNYEVQYEVVYIEVIDPGETTDQQGPPLSIDLSSDISNLYINSLGESAYADGVDYNIVYPNSSENMIKRIEQNIGYQDQSSLPAWMTSNQPDANSATGFTVPLGYTKAVVIAYANPGDGEKISYRIRQSGVNFNAIEFVADRYQLDNYYSRNYDVNELSYINDRETTFDADSNINVGSIVASVTYAVEIPFSQINGRPVSYIIENGGIDGITNFRDGETIIFAKQEQYEDAGPYDGWVIYSDSYIGDNVNTETVEGFSSGSYDTYTVVPGFLEKSQATSPVNKRGGVWRIDITAGIVNLTFVQEIDTNARVRVLFGKTLASAILIYSLDLTVGLTVPYYKVFTVNPTIRQRTTFNNDTTRFFTYRDQYYELGTQDKYVKFPQYGVFE
jgi:Putative Ig domain